MNISKLFEKDKLLKNFEPHLLKRVSYLNEFLKLIDEKYNSLSEFSLAHLHFGIHQNNSNIFVTEWIPNAVKVYLVGDFNNWNEDHELIQIDNDIFQLIIENADNSQMNYSRVKLKIVTKLNQIIYRASPWARSMVFNTKKNILEPIINFEKNKYVFKNQRPIKSNSMKIYEAHTGISSNKPEIATYSHFRTEILPRIKKLGYDTIQLMAVMEHAYYACFGYQVTNFYAPSSRFGSSDELKELIDEAHGMGLRVLLDLVHSHASINIDDGLNEFDGSSEGFFHGGLHGYHPIWKTRLFNYSKLPVVRFLISNLRWWIEEYQFDGFRFDGVSSMLYFDHGLKVNFTGEYYKYFDLNVDVDSIRYLMLANYFLKTIFPFVTTICEDVSGMPTLCRPLDEGGFGFDYRLAMGIPDMWKKMVQLNHTKNWDVEFIVSVLSNRRDKEKSIAYSESHDQALVGDKTLAFWLMDKYMYEHMSIFSPPSVVIDRGLSLHMMIRLITNSLGGESYLNFMGNEFGHPEWLDFPRLENKFSFKYARRQWDLVDNNDLKYKYLNNFDIRLHLEEEHYHWLSSNKASIIHVCNSNKIVAFTRAKCLFMFNFHQDNSYESYKIGVPIPGKYQCVLNTDSCDFGGLNRVDESVYHFSHHKPHHNEEQYLMVYLPSISGQICVLMDD